MLSLPGWLVYLTVFVATMLENVFPPTPSDVIVAVAGFLAHHRVTEPVPVFFAAWSGGMVASALVYLLARRYGRLFVAGRIGRRLLPPEAMAAMEREYLRLGSVGLFLARLIPGVRTFVAPFAGLVDLSPARALLPIALASALWYIGLTWVGVALGTEWDMIVAVVGRLNFGLGVFGIVVVAVIVAWRMAARRKRRRAQLQEALHAVLREEAGGEAGLIQAGAATLLAEIARADRTLGRAQLADIEACLREQWAATPVAGVPTAELPPAQTTSEVAAAVLDRYPQATRAAAMTRLRELLRGDSRLSPHQQQLLARAAELLGVDEVERTE
ncbi:MAG TPA: VTT domain-containing protein [Gemmatimonadales bacterium]|nr:VTT domain-containing protein [Gemmatimonadales bacterium]